MATDAGGSAHDDPDDDDIAEDDAGDENSLHGRPPFDPSVLSGFTEALMPKFDFSAFTSVFKTADYFKGISAKSLGIKNVDVLGHWNAQLREQQQRWFRSLKPSIDITMGVRNDYAETVRHLIGLDRVFENFRRTLLPLADQVARLQRDLLPPNLRGLSDQITFSEVHDFLEVEGIPLYLVPRASIAERLILAKDHAARRAILGRRFDALVDDCEQLIEQSDHPVVATEVHFIKDGIGAIRSGHHASAQAIFAVTLDTLVSRFHTDREERKKITNRAKGGAMPDKLRNMGVRRAYVWWPVWNAHEQFWKHKGDRIPHDFSRHATIHGVSKTQFSKRNCVQSLMLVSSLVGYANQLARSARK